jgi:predicted dehydrogenase
MATGKYNVGVIGYGLSAKTFHIPFINAVPEFNLYAVVQRSPKPDDDAEKDHPGVKAYRSVDELIKDDQVHLVIVTTAPESHLSLAKQALQAKKHGELSRSKPLQVYIDVYQSSLRSHSLLHRQRHRS